jgi:hypothetical protein
MPTSCAEARRFTGLASDYRRFVEGYAEVAAPGAPLTALGSPAGELPRAEAGPLMMSLIGAGAPHLRSGPPRGDDGGRERPRGGCHHPAPTRRQ